MSAAAIATIPAANHRGGVTAASSTPSAAQLSADSASATPSPARPPRSIQASANSAGTSSAQRARAPYTSRPSASAASGGTAHSARYVSPCALARSVARATKTKPITDSGGITAQRRPRTRASLGSLSAPGTATSAPCTSDSTAIDSQKGGMPFKIDCFCADAANAHVASLAAGAHPPPPLRRRGGRSARPGRADRGDLRARLDPARRTGERERRLPPCWRSPLSRVATRAHEQTAEENAIDHVLSYTPAISSGGAHGNEVALTFDDGPGPYTQQLVGVLNKLHVHATFFAIGEEERYFSAGTRLELRSGDVVGDHTETHPPMATLSAHNQHEELFEQIARIELLGGPRPRLFRPPYGSFNATTLRELRKLHLLMVLWSTDTSDYTLPGVRPIVQSALAGARPGAIILMHDAGGDRSETIAALPAIIAGLRKKGLQPVTIPRLMLEDPPPAGRPIPTSLAGD